MSAALEDLIAIVGRSGALALCSVAGGQRVYIGRAVPADHWIVATIGELQAARLAAAFAGERIPIPRPPIAAGRRAMARELRAQSYSIAEIADRMNLSERSVFGLLAVDDETS